MRFIVDAQLPPALARWLTGRGHLAEHVSDRGLATASDSAIWRFALTNQAVIVTKDEDFAQRKQTGSPGPVVIWVRVPNTTRKALLDWFDSIFNDILAAVERGETLIEVH